ncbi:MAG: class I SAM-dependent methyltransferase, partial [Candidatus Omnitrophica bacterium]|nr:class I SAM-dependent methyltransferase [Candidatus Omnitrophota bacterium]
DRIVPEKLGATEMGRDMLAQDYLLKQITASLINPDSDLGKEFWQKVYKKAYDQYGTTAIPIDTFNKVWIMPAKSTVYVQDDKAFIVESKLKVMLEEDYVALENNKGVKDYRGKGLQEKSQPKADPPPAEKLNQNTTPSNPPILKSPNPPNNLASEIVREVFIPALEKEVNEGKNFAQLRQIYNSLILAYWFKNNLKNSILNKVYSDKKKIKGIELEGLKGQRGKGLKETSQPEADPPPAEKLNTASSSPLILKSSDPQSDVQQIYSQYVETFKKGVCNMMKVEYDPYAKKNLPRKYFAGGVEFGKPDSTYTGDKNVFYHYVIENKDKQMSSTFVVNFSLYDSNGQDITAKQSPTWVSDTTQPVSSNEEIKKTISAEDVAKVLDKETQKRFYGSFKNQPHKILPSGDIVFLSTIAADKNLLEELVRRITALAGKNTRFLSIGEGWGHLVKALKRAWKNKGQNEIRAIDYSPDNVAKSQGQVVLGDAYNLEYRQNYFDVVIFNLSIGALELKSVFEEAKRVLKPGGRVIVTEYDYDGEIAPQDLIEVPYMKYPKEKITKALEEAGFENILCDPIPSALGV